MNAPAKSSEAELRRESPPTADFAPLSAPEALRVLDASPDGLSGDDARRRRDDLGPNEIPVRRRSPILDLLSRFWGPMPWLLEAAVALSLLMGRGLEAAIIGGLIAVNAAIGYHQSRISARAVGLLRGRLAVRAKILRDGAWQALPAADAVPGDIVVIQMGDIVPADAKLLSGRLSVDQSALTGESLPVEAGEGAVVYSGSVAARGEARALVVNTGPRTAFGRTARLVETAGTASRQERTIALLVRRLMVFGAAALAIVVADGILIGSPPMLLAAFAVTLLLGSVPVALPAVLTIVEAVGAMELARAGVLVTRLESMNDASSVDVLCLDKTGTITMNRLSVEDVLASPGFGRDDVLRTAALATDPDSKDPIDAAVVSAVRAAGAAEGPEARVSVRPFDPALKTSEAVVETPAGRSRAAKGAPQAIVALCDASGPDALSAAGRAVEDFSRRGFRALAVARSEPAEPDRLRLVGLLALADPPRPDAGDMIAEIRRLGVRPLMVTGDHAAIAREIAARVGLRGPILRIGELAGLDEAEQARRLDGCAGLAEVYPEDKHRIVRLLQTGGRVVGMTGDGVNDAPALKQAEVGIAVDGATDVARASANLVLTRPGIRVIVDAVTTSRRIYQRVLTWVLNKIVKTVQLLVVLTAGFLWLRRPVVSLLGMALLVLANDFVTMSLATDRVSADARPDVWNVRALMGAGGLLGLLFALEAGAVLAASRAVFGADPGRSLTALLLLLVFTSQFRVFLLRERAPGRRARPGRALSISAPAAVAAFFLAGVFGIAMAPLPAAWVAALLGFSAVFTLAMEGPKRVIFRSFGLYGS